MSGSQRRLVGSLGIIVYLTVWVVAAATIGSGITHWPWWGQIAFFFVAGTIWIAPLKPVFAWMGRGRPG